MSDTEHRGVLFEAIHKLININPRVRRISSMFLDYFIVCMPFIILVFLGMLISITEIIQISSFGLDITFYILLFILFNKDFFRGKSLAKRILGYQVIDVKTEKPANEFQCFIRNIIIYFLWPIEIIMVLIQPEKRIGDYMAGTKVITAKKEKTQTLRTDIKDIKFKSDYIGILILSIMYFYIHSQLF